MIEYTGSCVSEVEFSRVVMGKWGWVELSKVGL